MMRIASSLASLKLTLAGLVGAIVVALMSSASPGMDIGFIVIPLALLSINLLAAIMSNKAFRVQVPLLIFHVCLLAVLLLVGIGVLIGFEGHVEMVEGEDFNASGVQATRVGAMHPSRMNDISFTQREIEVSFLPGLLRRDTRSVVSVEESGRAPQDIILNDQTSMTMDGYRFIPTFNKGFAVVVVWSDADGRLQRGSVNFPSFPRYEWKQVNTWMAPGGEKIRFELKLPATDRREQAWVLRSRNLPFSVEIDHGRMAPRGLQAGESIQLRDGILTIEDLRVWMGYRIDFDPLLPWILAAAFAALIALAIHFQTKFWPARRPSRSKISKPIMAHDSCN
jgi:cytochrome c biogenesis protein